MLDLNIELVNSNKTNYRGSKTCVEIRILKLLCRDILHFLKHVSIKYLLNLSASDICSPN